MGSIHHLLAECFFSLFARGGVHKMMISSTLGSTVAQATHQFWQFTGVNQENSKIIYAPEHSVCNHGYQGYYNCNI